LGQPGQQVWGLNLFGVEDGKKAINKLRGKEPHSYDENGNPVYLKDEKAIPNVPK
jgi:hypothetical protein